MSDSNFVDFYAVRETAFGETPDQSKKLKEFGFTVDALKHQKMTEASEEVNSDRAEGDDLEVGREGNGDLSFELKVGAYDEFFEAVLNGAFTAGSAAAVTCAIDEGAQTITIGAGTFSAALRGAKYLKVTGAATPANNGIKRLVSATTTVLTFAAGSFTTDEATPSLTIAYNYVREGSTKYSYLTERKFSNLTPTEYVYQKGMTVGSISLDLQPRTRATGSITFLGTEGVASATTAGDGSPTAISTNPVVTTGSGVQDVLIDGATSPSAVRSIQLELNNNLRARPKLGSLVTLKPGIGDMTITGTVETYFDDKTLFRKFMDHGVASILLPIMDSGPRLISVFLPRVRLREGQPNSGGKNQDILPAFEFSAKKDATLGYVCQIDCLDASS